MLERIRELCKEKGISLRELSDACGIGAKSIFIWDKANPGIDKVKAVAEYLGVSIDYLVGTNSEVQGLSENESYIIQIYRDMNGEGQERLIEQAEFLAQSGKYKKRNFAEMEA